MTKTEQAQIQLRCSCGSVQGLVRKAPKVLGVRLVCYCDDCQAYAEWLGRATELLDAPGGTDIFQITPAQLEITSGHGQLRCMRLSPKGLMRWHTDCCKTPVGNTMASRKVPFVGVPHLFIGDFNSDKAGQVRGDRLVGPVQAKIHGRLARGEMPADAHARAPIGFLFRSLCKLSGDWWRGAASPSPFFDETTGEPIVEPMVLSKAERAELAGYC